jgi:hypothetical protein
MSATLQSGDHTDGTSETHDSWISRRRRPRTSLVHVTEGQGFSFEQASPNPTAGAAQAQSSGIRMPVELRSYRSRPLALLTLRGVPRRLAFARISAQRRAFSKEA